MIGMIKEYIKYDPCNPRFNHEEFKDWLKEHCVEQIYQYTVVYDGCYRCEQKPYQQQPELVATGRHPEHTLSLDGDTVPPGCYLVVSDSGKVVVMPSWIIREYYWGDGD